MFKEDLDFGNYWCAIYTLFVPSTFLSFLIRCEAGESRDYLLHNTFEPHRSARARSPPPRPPAGRGRRATPPRGRRRPAQPLFLRFKFRDDVFTINLLTCSHWYLPPGEGIQGLFLLGKGTVWRYPSAPLSKVEVTSTKALSRYSESWSLRSKATEMA